MLQLNLLKLTQNMTNTAFEPTKFIQKFWAVPEWLCNVLLSSFDFATPKSVPPEMKLPIEGSPVQLKAPHISKCVVIDDVNHRAHNPSPIFSNSGNQIFEPAWKKNIASSEIHA